MAVISRNILHRNTLHKLYKKRQFSTTIKQPPTKTTTATTTGNVIKDKNEVEWKDPALLWAANNPIIAKACMDIPEVMPNNDTIVFDSSSNDVFPFQSFDDYWQWRQWYFPETTEIESIYGKALASHVLSSPLTIASKLLFPTIVYNKLKENDNNDNNNNNNNDKNNNIVRWGCIGARAEATLPVEYWKEMLFIQKYFQQQQQTQRQEMNNVTNDIIIDFIGPEIDISERLPIKLHLQHNTIQNNTILPTPTSTLTLQWLYKGTFHDFIASSEYDNNNNNNIQHENQYDAFILLNPGIGHPYLQKLWKPTIDILVHTIKKPILLTAHSKIDANRDELHLQKLYGTNSNSNNNSNNNLSTSTIKYYKNPFASHIQYKDPLSTTDDLHFVSPNSYISLIEFI